MNSILLFEEACSKLEATSSRKAKEEILFPYLANDEVRELFRLAIDPNEQFYVVLEPREDPSNQTYKSLLEILHTLSWREFSQQGAQELAETHISGKWIRRLINKNLKVGVAEGTLNKLFPGLIKPLPLALAEEINFGGENWQTLIHHLEGAKNWYVQADPKGMRCVVEVRAGKVFPKVPLVNFQFIEQDLIALFRNESVILDGRLVYPPATTPAQVYEAFLNPKFPLEELQKASFQILDVISASEIYSKRRDYLVGKFTYLSIELVENVNFPLMHLGMIDSEPIDYKQITQMRQQGYKKCWLRNGNSLYVTGKSRDLLSLAL